MRNSLPSPRPELCNQRSVMRVHLSLALFAASLTAHAASPINCAKASDPTEHTICHTPSLLQADACMTAYYEIAIQFVGMGVRGDLGDSQQAGVSCFARSMWDGQGLHFGGLQEADRSA
jgi:hypothetical protein